MEFFDLLPTASILSDRLNVQVVHNWMFMGQEEGYSGRDDDDNNNNNEESKREHPGNDVCPVWDDEDDAIAGFAISVSTGHIFSGYEYHSATRFSRGVMINGNSEPTEPFPRAAALGRKQVERTDSKL
ncbi:hypothetical protein Hte_005609 [Hypoxylon texense]